MGAGRRASRPRQVAAVGAVSSVMVLTVLDGVPALLLAGTALLVGMVVAGARALPPPSRGEERSHDRWQRVRWELERARRHGRPLVLARLPLVASADDATARQLPLEVRPLLRATDDVWVDRNDLMLLMPEVTSAQVQPALARVAAALGARAMSGGARVAAFPEDGLTLVALCQRIADPRSRRRGRREMSTVDEVMEQAS